MHVEQNHQTAGPTKGSLRTEEPLRKAVKNG